MPTDKKGICVVCGESPTIAVTGMCGPCSFGTSDAVGEGDTWPDPPAKEVRDA